MRYGLLLNGINGALRVVIRMSRTAIGKKLLQALTTEWKTLGRSVHIPSFENSARTVFVTVTQRSLRSHSTGNGTEPYQRIRRTRVSMRSSRRRGFFMSSRGAHRRSCATLSRPGRDVDLIEGETPLWLTLQSGCHKMAKALLQEGANIDDLGPDETRTAYWRAYEESRGNNQYFLIKEGVDTRQMSQYSTPQTTVENSSKPSIKTEWK